MLSPGFDGPKIELEKAKMKEYKEESFLESNIRTACETAKNIILLGDFNINYFNKNDNLTEKLENICNTNNLSQQILKPTRFFLGKKKLPYTTKNKKEKLTIFVQKTG